MTDRELLQEALDALTYVGDKDIYSGTIDALRARLAQPEPAECDGGQCGIGGYCKQCPKTQLEQKPVAWMYVNFDDECEQIEYGKPFDDPSVTPLYAAPPRCEWVGLTDEERLKTYLEAGSSHTKYGKAIEAKLKEKNT